MRTYASTEVTTKVESEPVRPMLAPIDNLTLRHLCTAARSRPFTALGQHVPIACTALLFWFQVCKHRLAGAFTSLSIGVAGNCFIGLLIGFALQPVRVPSYPVLVTPTCENTPRPELGVCGCGSCIYGEPSVSQSQWSETARAGIASSSGLP